MSYLFFHLKELFFRSLYPLFFSFLGFFLFSNYFLELLLLLLSHSGSCISFLLLSSPFDAFSSLILLSSFLSLLFFFFPLSFIHLYIFFRPAILYPSLLFLLLSDIFFFTSCFLLPFFSFFISLSLLPFAIDFLLSPFFHIDLSSIFFWFPKVSSFLSLFYYITIFTLVLISLPLLIIWAQFKVGNPLKVSILSSFMQSRPFILFAILLGLSIITPPDLISLLVISLPLILILELSYMLSLLILSYHLKVT